MTLSCLRASPVFRAYFLHSGDTLRAGLVVDQAARHGPGRKVRDLGTLLVLVGALEDDPVSHRGVRRNDTMTKGRRTATIVGVLYTIGTFAADLGVVPWTLLLNDSQYLVKLAENRSDVTAGTLLVLIIALVWLIAKGFDPSAIVSGLDKLDSSTAGGKALPIILGWPRRSLSGHCIIYYRRFS
jgi:hypothetical protein